MWTILSAFFFTLASLLVPPLAEARMVDEASEVVLENGLKVIMIENHKVPVVTFQVWYRSGSRRDPWGRSGLAHLFEHLMFKGTRKTSGEEFTRTIQRLGGEYNAFTSSDFAAYFETLSSDRFHIALELEADRMENLVLQEEEFRTERQVVVEERRLRTADNPKASLFEQLSATAFQTQPYHWPIVGWMADLKRITLEDARMHYGRYYCPANAFIVVVGDFDRKKLTSRIQKTFGSIHKGPSSPLEKYEDPPQRGERTVHLLRDAELPFMALGYHVPRIGSPDSFPLEVLAAILSLGKSSRFHENLVRGGLTVSADAENALVSVDPGLFVITAEALPGKSLSEVRDALEKELENLRREKAGTREIEKAVNGLESSFVFSQDSFFMQALLVGRFEIASTWKDVDNYIPGLRKVTPEEVRRVVRRYLVPENRTVAILVPTKEKKTTYTEERGE